MRKLLLDNRDLNTARFTSNQNSFPVKFIVCLTRVSLFLFVLILFCACGNETKQNSAEESEKIKDSLAAEKEYKVLDSRFIFKDSLWSGFTKELSVFSEERYIEIREQVLDKNIPEIQKSIQNKKFNYEELVLFYLYRIHKYDRENDLSLNSVISLNPNLLEEARECDKSLEEEKGLHPIFGIPVLLKDNINTVAMPTTAGALALKNNETDDAFIVKRLKENGALILGKANLSEWAYFFCGDCPSGYSAMGGQTLNPYGRKIFDTGGSSSGSAVAVAVNLAPVAVGSETSGSILSPSSQNSVVGLKPTVGLLSRGGIVPISSTLDTPGPITKSVIDNAILFSAMVGKDEADFASKEGGNPVSGYYSEIKNTSLSGVRLGAIKKLLEEDSLYVQAVEDLKEAGAEIVAFETEDIQLSNFLRLLSLDMKKDLPEYFEKYGGETGFSSVEDLVKFNIEDSTSRMPYGQALFEGILQDSATEKEFTAIKDTLYKNGIHYFKIPMEKYNLDGVLSINNIHAGFAAVARYPAITIPMGYEKTGRPKGLTIISKSNGEQQLFNWAAAYENATNHRISPKKYTE